MVNIAQFWCIMSPMGMCGIPKLTTEVHTASSTMRSNQTN